MEAKEDYRIIVIVDDGHLAYSVLADGIDLRGGCGLLRKTTASDLARTPRWIRHPRPAPVFPFASTSAPTLQMSR